MVKKTYFKLGDKVLYAEYEYQGTTPQGLDSWLLVHKSIRVVTDPEEIREAFGESHAPL